MQPQQTPRHELSASRFDDDAGLGNRDGLLADRLETMARPAGASGWSLHAEQLAQIAESLQQRGEPDVQRPV